MTETVEVRSSTTTMVIDGRGGEGSSHVAPKKSFMDHFYATFSSPIAWVLVLALIITWSCVFVIIFDMMDYKTLSGPPPAVRKTLKDTERRGKAPQGDRPTQTALQTGLHRQPYIDRPTQAGLHGHAYIDSLTDRPT